MMSLSLGGWLDSREPPQAVDENFDPGERNRLSGRHGCPGREPLRLPLRFVEMRSARQPWHGSLSRSVQRADPEPLLKFCPRRARYGFGSVSTLTLGAQGENFSEFHSAIIASY